MSREYPVIAQQFIEGQRVKPNARLFQGRFFPDPDYIGGVNAKSENGPMALFSYGPHFPLLIATTRNPPYTGFYLNEDKYETTDEDRIEAGWGPKRQRSPKFSVTTSRQQWEIRLALQRAGFSPTDTIVSHEVEDGYGDNIIYKFRLWKRLEDNT